MNDRIKAEINNFTNNIVKLREKYGLSEKEMAKILGISIETLKKTETGEIPRDLSVEVIFEIYDNFGITPKELFKSS